MKVGVVALMMGFTLGGWGQGLKTITVGPAGSRADFATVQEAVTAAPETGAVIRIRPGIYREVVHVDKANIQMRGETKDASTVVIVDDMGDPKTCGTFCSPTMFVTGDGFVASNLTISNDLSKTGKPRTQGVALSITGDRAVLRNVRLLGAQDTLYAASRKCAAGAECKASRQYYDHCYIEGEVDFIFGNAKAVFHDCEIHSVVHEAGGYLTAQSRNSVAEDSGYVFDHCRVTAEPGVSKVYLGRPWRDYATVTFLNTELRAHIAPAGWSEWHQGETDRLKTASYAEYRSTGPGANVAEREPLSKQLTADEAKGYEVKKYLAGSDGWDAAAVK
ncbi:pectinesterase family protein [Granulicella tundricola]|uniref:Pectinesterase n=1 Tax=Granulicella tundricola (strain ATCC BAA-1859 / DSM 23138 / MP5ACTX9) TaxID=1198114 RepID=E8X4A6_GRATM|nr:pectinesterase family protein [Granulicella tundricola]ADW68233.1 Pectinesterase [Granulicella tundricola MP5ACTX9]